MVSALFCADRYPGLSLHLAQHLHGHEGPPALTSVYRFALANSICGRVRFFNESLVNCFEEPEDSFRDLVRLRHPATYRWFPIFTLYTAPG